MNDEDRESPSSKLLKIVRWEAGKDDDDDPKWDLMRPDGTSAATVWCNGTWHTWDHDGVGGENSSEDTVDAARMEAVISAINQGFILAGDLTKLPARHCPNCSSEKLTWHAGAKNHGGAQDGRICMREVGPIFFLGCDECSETLSVIAGEEVAEMLTRMQSKSQ